jgi:hypothetical protein
MLELIATARMTQKRIEKLRIANPPKPEFELIRELASNRQISALRL